MASKPKISKSQYGKGLQCPKALWFYRHRKDLKPPIDTVTQARFDAGNPLMQTLNRFCQTITRATPSTGILNKDASFL